MSFDNIIKNLGVEMERNAASALGTEVEKFARQQVGSIISSNRQLPDSAFGGLQNVAGTASASSTGAQNNQSMWQSVQYAADMVTLAPKHRFLFKVHFHFNPPYVGDQDQRVFSYMIKEISRPKVNFDYQDINMYNYRTKVLTNMKHEPMTITFYDDIGNNVQEFFNYYLRAHSPINRTNIETSSAQWETSGMNFNPPNPSRATGGEYSASIGQLNDGAINILHYIELEQYFAHGTKKNIFKFINPRVESFDFDDSSVEGQDLHWMKMQFNFDGLIVETIDAKNPTKGAFGGHDIMGNTEPWVNQSGNPTHNPDKPNITMLNAAMAKSNVASPMTQLTGMPGYLGNAVQDAASSLLTPGAITGMITQAAFNGKDAVLGGLKSNLEAHAKRTLFGAASKIGHSAAGMVGKTISEGASGLIQSAKTQIGKIQIGSNVFGSSEGE